MTPDLHAARQHWLDEQAIYTAVWEHVVATLQARCKAIGVFACITGRTKDTGSILKKLIAKRHDYNAITDKAGARVVVRFREQLRAIESLIERTFVVIHREDKVEKLGHNRVGYQAVHYDVVLPPEDAPAELQNRQCEIQVRTLCHNLWAEMDHDLSYKPAEAVAHDISRQINLLNALLELADRHFSSINSTIRSSASLALRVLNNLEVHYYHFAARPYDLGLSQKSVELLLPLYEQADSDQINLRIDAFVESNTTKLSHVYDQYGRIEDPPLFLYQPELYMTLHLLEQEPFVLDETWCSTYPREELERLATMWGNPLA